MSLIPEGRTIKEQKDILELEKNNLQMKVLAIDEQLRLINNLQKPFVANVSAYSGHYSMQYKTEKGARKKLQEYARKKYFKNGLNYGVYLYRWKEDGTKELLETIPMGNKNFKPNI